MNDSKLTGPWWSNHTRIDEATECPPHGKLTVARLGLPKEHFQAENRVTIQAFWEGIFTFDDVRGFCFPVLLSFALACLAGSSAGAQQPAPVSAPAEDFLFLCLNPAVAPNTFTTRPQLDLAGQAGINRVTFYAADLPHDATPSPASWKKSDARFSLFTEGSRTALLAPRLPLVANVGDAGLTSASAVLWKDGPTNILSWADPAVQQAALNEVRSVVQHYEASPFASRIWAYHLSAQQTGEWFPTDYRAHGADYSQPSQRAFRAWLSKTYGTDAALQKAWGRPALCLAAARVPTDDDRRFPIRPAGSNEVIQAFYQLPREQDWVDYSRFTSDLNAGIIRKLAAQVKASSNGRKAVIVFYGYIFELASSICGHLAAAQLLNDGNIDFVASPISYVPYNQRLAGGAGAPMGAVDSYALHGKTWINEDDLHTHVQAAEAKIPSWYWDIHNPQFHIPADLAETRGILERNLAFAAFHHSATWWMDLYGGGWYSDPGIWQIWTGPFGARMRAVRTASLPYSPAVAVVVDEESRFYEKFTRSFIDLYPNLRNALQGCGTTVGFYYLDDFLAGRVPPTAATVFVNVWRLDPARRSALQARLRQRNTTAIWQYAPGFLDPDAQGVDGIRALTGIETTSDQGRLGSTGAGPLAGSSFGGTGRIDPRIVISDTGATPLARYRSDQAVSAAAKTVNGLRQVLVADDAWTAGMAHALLKECGVPLISDQPAVIESNGRTLFVYATGPATLTLTAPPGTAFEAGGAAMTLKLEKNENRVFSLTVQAGPESR